MSRARKAEKSELNKLLKEINKRMSDFEDSVQKLQDLKECAEELDERIAQQAAMNKNKLEQLEKDFQENKIRAIRRAASELGKEIITTEELEELRSELEKVKAKGEDDVKARVESHRARFEMNLTQQIELKNLKHEAETAKLQAEAESHKKEVENLKETLKRMSEELQSQKDLTASLVAPRQQPASTTT